MLFTCILLTYFFCIYLQFWLVTIAPQSSEYCFYKSCIYSFNEILSYNSATQCALHNADFLITVVHNVISPKHISALYKTSRHLFNGYTLKFSPQSKLWNVVFEFKFSSARKLGMTSLGTQSRHSNSKLPIAVPLYAFCLIPNAYTCHNHNNVTITLHKSVLMRSLSNCHVYGRQTPNMDAILASGCRLHCQNDASFVMF